MSHNIKMTREKNIGGLAFRFVKPLYEDLVWYA